MVLYIYSFGVALIGLTLFSVITGTTLEKSQPDVPPDVIEKKALFYPPRAIIRPYTNYVLPLTLLTVSQW